jgi:hypothetical protein
VCQATARALADKARTVRIPRHIVGKLNKIGRAERKLVTGLGREPTVEEIAEVTGIEPEEVESIKRSAQAPISLQKPVGDEEESEFGQLIADEQAESPYERAVEVLTKEALSDALENLGYRERRDSSCATASAASTRAHSTRSGARSTSPASGSAKSKTVAQEAPKPPRHPEAGRRPRNRFKPCAPQAQVDARRGDLGSRRCAQSVAQPINQIAPIVVRSSAAGYTRNCPQARPVLVRRLLRRGDARVSSSL